MDEFKQDFGEGRPRSNEQLVISLDDVVYVYIDLDRIIF